MGILCTMCHTPYTLYHILYTICPPDVFFPHVLVKRDLPSSQAGPDSASLRPREAGLSFCRILMLMWSLGPDIYVYIHIYIHVCIYICVRRYARTYMYIYMYIYTYMDIDIDEYLYKRIQASHAALSSGPDG